MHLLCVCVHLWLKQSWLKLQLLPLLTFLGVVKFWLGYILQHYYHNCCILIPGTLHSHMVSIVSWYGVIPVGM